LSLFPEFTKGLALHIIFAAFLGILVMAYLLRPTGYVLKDKGILIERGWGKISIPYSCIKGVKMATKPLVSSRLFVGNGGLFGYYGFFTTRKAARSGFMPPAQIKWYRWKRKRTCFT